LNGDADVELEDARCDEQLVSTELINAVTVVLSDSRWKIVPVLFEAKVASIIAPPGLLVLKESPYCKYGRQLTSGTRGQMYFMIVEVLAFGTCGSSPDDWPEPKRKSPTSNTRAVVPGVPATIHASRFDLKLLPGLNKNICWRTLCRKPDLLKLLQRFAQQKVAHLG